MKTLLSLCLLLAAIVPAQANVSGSSYTTQTVTIPGGSCTLDFGIFWTCLDYPINSTPGRVELINSQNQLVGWAQGTITHSGPSGQSNGGSVTVNSSYMHIMGFDMTVADGEFYGTWNLTGLAPGTYTLRFWDYTNEPVPFTNTVWTHTFFQSVSAPPPANRPPVVTLVAPGAQTVTAGATLTITSHATDPDGNISNHNLDLQRPAGDWNFEGAFATGEPFQGGPVGSGGDSRRTASFTFTDVGTYAVRSAAFDGTDWSHSATVTITVVAPPPVQFTLSTIAGSGGTVTPGGTYTAGTAATVTATPDPIHDFIGWTGDAGGATNPLGVLLDRNKVVQAGFALKTFTLTTSASGGSVTPGGTYPYGSTVTVSATPDATHRFVGWTGDASGGSVTTAVTMTGPKTVRAVFVLKSAQTITFPAPADQHVGSSFPLTATASSGLPTTFTVLSGPATLAGGILAVTGPGVVTVQAAQAGDDTYLPAPPIIRTFNAAAPVVLKYTAAARTLLQSGATPEGIPYVIQTQP